QAIKQLAIQRGPYALAPAAGIERDADLHGLPKGLMVAVAVRAGVARNAVAALGNEESVGADQCELLEPVASFLDADRPGFEGRDRVRRRVVENFDDLGKVGLGRGPDIDGARAGRIALVCPSVQVRRALGHAGTLAGPRRGTWGSRR